MTDQREGRLDLRALDAADEAARTDAAIASVMARITDPGAANANPSAARDLQFLLRYQRRLLAAAAVLAAIATAAIVRTASPPNDVLAEWAASSHVPTNGELLAAFHGYRP